MNIGNIFSAAGKYLSGGWMKNMFQAVPLFIKNGFNVSAYKKDISSSIDSATGANLTGAEKQQNAFNAQQAQLNRDWQEEMSNTAFQRQAADMQAAGINPALMYGVAGSSGASTPAGNAASGSAHSGNLGDVLQMLSFGKQLKNLDLQNKNLQKDIDSKDTDIRKREQDILESKSRENLNNIEAHWRDQLNAAREASELARADYYKSHGKLSDEQRKYVAQERYNLQANLELMREKVKTEKAQQLVLKSREVVNYANAGEINALIPFKKKLMDAQSGNQLYQGTLAYVNALYKEQFIDDRYVDALVDAAVAEAREKGFKADQAEVAAAMADVKKAIKTGDLDSAMDSGLSPSRFVLSTALDLFGSAFGSINLFGNTGSSSLPLGK